jgi:lipopolysaccharide heptosyltransferase II
VDHTLQPLPGPLLAVHAGARWASKRWPVEKFAAVASKAMRRFGFSVVLVGSADERAIGEELRRVLTRLDSPHNVLDLTGQTTLKQLAAVLRTANALLTNDSGPMHLAASLGTPVLGVFTCTSPKISGPPGDQHELVSTHVPCAASYKKRCPNRGARHLACMDDLSTERVCQAYERLMLKNQLAARAA